MTKRLRGAVKELLSQLAIPEAQRLPSRVTKAATDVGNFAMMLEDLAGSGCAPRGEG